MGGSQRVHLAQARAYLHVMPKIADYIPEAYATGQFAMHTLAVLVWLGACLWSGWLAYAAGGLLLASGVWLAANMLSALRRYRQTLKAMAELPWA